MLSYFVKEALQAALKTDDVSTPKCHIPKGKTWKGHQCYPLFLLYSASNYVFQSGAAYNTMLLLHFPFQDFGGSTAKREDWSEQYLKSGDVHVNKRCTVSLCAACWCSSTTRQRCWHNGPLSDSICCNPFLFLQDAVINLFEEICHILPSSYRDQCDAVISKYGKTVLDAILGYATPQAICALIHMCKGQEAPIVGQSASLCFHYFDSQLINAMRSWKTQYARVTVDSLCMVELFKVTIFKARHKVLKIKYICWNFVLHTVI